MKTFSRCILGVLVLGGVAGACNGSDGSGSASGGSQNTGNGGATATTTQSAGGTQQSGGSQNKGGSEATGGTPSAGGSSSSGGTTTATGGSSNGGTDATGGRATGGSVATGGKAAGGVTATNGGSTAAAGKSNGGTAAGGTATGGTVASGGKATGGAATGGAATGGAATGGATATPCSFTTFSAPASPTYTTYDLPNAITACGYKGSNNQIKNIVTPANFAAIPGNTSSDFNTNNRCGACVQIGSAIVTIVDECPNDSNPPCKANPSGHLDLSKAAASSAGVQGDPNKKGQAAWKYVPCPINGNVVVRLKSGNNNEFFIENEILPIASVTCNSQTGSRTSYGAWHFTVDVNGQSCSATDVAGRSVTFKVGTTQDQDVDTGVQFPKCT